MQNVGLVFSFPRLSSVIVMDLLRLEWPKPTSPSIETKQTIAGFGGVRIRTKRGGDRAVFIPFNNWRSAKHQEEKILKTLEPNEGKKEEEQVEITPPAEAVKIRKAEVLEDKEVEEKEKRNKRMKTIFE